MEIGDVLPPAFFPVSLNVSGRRCVVVGDDREADEKAEMLIETGAVVERIADPSAATEERLGDPFFVILTTQDPQAAARLRAIADRRRFLYCAIDQPRYGFVAMSSIVRAGPARIAISTGGVAPAVAKAIRRALDAALGPRFAAFLERMRALRVRTRASGAEAAERRRVMTEAADGFALEVAVRYPRWFEEGRDEPGEGS